MFKHDYQGGPYFEIFSAQGKDGLVNWKLVGSPGIKKVYEKEVKGFVYSLEGSSSTTKMTLPKDLRQSLVLVQHYLIFQSYVKRGQDFAIELGIVDISCNKRRILLSTSQRGVQSTPLHAKVPLNIIKRGMWLNLCIDLVSLVSDLWKGQTFKAVDSVCVTATCQLRKIFSMKRPPYETAVENDINQNSQTDCDQIPKQCQFANDVQQETQMINLKRIEKSDKLQNNDTRENQFSISQPHSSLDVDQKHKSHIAFGSKVPYLAPKRNSHKRHSADANSQLTSRKTNGSSLSNAEKNLPSCSSVTSSVNCAHPSTRTNTNRYNSPVETKQLECNMSFKPHPPHEPSSEKNRRRIRVRSAGRELNSERTSAKTSNTLANSESHLSPHRKTPLNVSEGEGPKNRLISNQKILQKKPASQADRSKKSYNESVMHSEMVLQKCQDDKTCDDSFSSEFIDDGVAPDVPEIQSPRKPVEMDDSLSAVIAMLKTGSVMADNELSERSSSSEYADSDLEFDVQNDPVYVFTSLPKSAPECSHSPIQDNGTANVKSKGHPVDAIYSVRGAKPEDDFISTLNGSDDDDDDDAGSTAADTAMSSRSSSSHCMHTQSNSATSSRGSSSKSVSSRVNIPLPEKGSQLPVHSQVVPPQVFESKSNLSHQSELPHHTKSIPYDSRQYTTLTIAPNEHQHSLSKLSRKSLREVSPSNIPKSLARSVEKPYDSSKYQTMDVMDSLEEQMLTSMKRQRDEELALYQKKLSESGGGSADPLLANHLYDDSITTNSDDDTTFNSLKVPLALRFAHNYKEEMKYPCRHSSDTLSSSNPRDWSNLFSPPIVLASEISQKPLQASLEAYTDDNLTTDVVDQKDEDEKEQLQLLYDPVLSYYYDPKSRKYYELV